jgi:hypothetical protein
MDSFKTEVLFEEFSWDSHLKEHVSWWIELLVVKDDLGEV